MRLATYNLWNDEETLPVRLPLLCRTLRDLQSDVLALQEVSGGAYTALRSALGAEYFSFYDQFPGEDEGLAVFSRFPIEAADFLPRRAEYSQALFVRLRLDAGQMCCMNVHLPWDSVRARELQALAAHRYLCQQAAQEDVCLLLGDFNGGLGSSVHRFLTGEQTLRDEEAAPCYFELGSTWGAVSGTPLRATMDFQRNPRWRGGNTTEAPAAFDRIYLRRRMAEDQLHRAFLFGEMVDEATGLCPSDHYGLAADISLARVRPADAP